MKKIIYSLSLLTFYSFVSIAQDYDVNWGEKGVGKGDAYKILPISGSEFYSLRRTGSAMMPTVRVAHHKNFQMTHNERVVNKVNGSSATIELTEVIGGKFVVFLSDRDGSEMKFFLQEYSEALEPKGKALELASFEIEKKKPRGSFDVIMSQDKEFFAVEWTLPGKREESDRHGYKVYDNELNEVSTGMYELPFDGNLTGFSHTYLSNTGDYFRAVSEYKDSEKKRLIGSYVDYKAMHLFHITPDGAEQYTVETNGRRIESLTLNSDNDGIFSLVGAYGKEDVGGVDGLFNIKLDFFKETVISEKFEPFTKDFIMNDWTDRAKEKAAKNKAKGKGEPKLYSYKMRQTEVLKDGSVVGSMEQYYVSTTTTVMSNGSTRTTYYYHYNDVVVFKIGKTGEFDWVKKVDKYQVSTNDGGPYSSYSRFVDGDNIVLIFNDNVDNYSEKGDFSPKPDKRNPGLAKIKSARYSKSKNVVAAVKFDIESGESERNVMIDREELEAIAVPKLFNVDYTKGEVLLYAKVGSRERIGLLEID